MDFLHTNPYVKGALTLFLIMYASMARPELPPVVKKLFENPIFRLAILALIVYNGNQNPEVSIITALFFILSMNQLSELELKEGFEQIEQFQKLVPINV